MSNPPTPAQIAQVQTNLTNLQKFNDYVYTYGQSRVSNAYDLLTEQDDSDLGLTIGLNVVEGAFWAVAAAASGGGAVVGGFMASFLSGMVSYWASDTPPSLNGTFASLWIRLSKTSEAVDTQLATYHSDVAGNWDQQFTYNGKTATLSDLATLTVPVETDTEFTPLADAALFALDQLVWTTVLKASLVVTLWEMTGPTSYLNCSAAQMLSDDEGLIAKHPAYYQTWTWHKSSGCGDSSGWDIQQYNLGTGASAFHDGSISDDACAYLFIDSADGVVINASGLFSRKTVFTGLGIKQTTYYVSNGGGGVGAAAPTMETLSLGYLRAMKRGETLGLLIEREGREAVERRVIEKAQRDPIFATDLSYRPRQTLEEFLGVRIPEVVAVTAIVENGRSFAFVVPMLAQEETGTV